MDTDRRTQIVDAPASASKPSQGAEIIQLRAHELEAALSNKIDPLAPIAALQIPGMLGDAKARRARAERHARTHEREEGRLDARLAAIEAAIVQSRPTVVSSSAPTGTTEALGETCDAWFERYFTWKKTLPGKNGSVRQDRSKYKKWISPRLGHLPISAPKQLLADAIEELRDDFSDAVRAYNENGKGKAALDETSQTSGRNAQGIWGVLVTGFNYASTAPKRSGLRVRNDNPCDGIRAPEKSPRKYKTVLRPIEWLQVARCEQREWRAWRETYAVMLYSGLRPGEGWVLEWPDVDFTTNKIHVSKAWDYDEQCVKHTKTGETRDVDIEPSLRPLLLMMRKRCCGRGPVLPALSGLSNETALSKIIRRHLMIAGVERRDLFVDPNDPKAAVTKIAFRFRSLRDTYVTWRLWRGDNPFAVQRAAGHARFSTTEQYLGDVEKLSPECGEAFPPLPASLLRLGGGGSDGHGNGGDHDGGSEGHSDPPHASGREASNPSLSARSTTSSARFERTFRE